MSRRYVVSTLFEVFCQRSDRGYYSDHYSLVIIGADFSGSVRKVSAEHVISVGIKTIICFDDISALKCLRRRLERNLISIGEDCSVFICFQIKIVFAKVIELKLVNIRKAFLFGHTHPEANGFQIMSYIITLLDFLCQGPCIKENSPLIMELPAINAKLASCNFRKTLALACCACHGYF